MDDMQVLTSLRHMIDVAQPPVEMGAPLPTGFWVAIVDYVNAAPRLLVIVEAALKRQEIEDHPLLVIDALDEEYEHRPITEDGLSER